ncbi:chromosome transmission fidelity protein 1, partial [Tremellales sp. Uapishka_1]
MEASSSTSRTSGLPLETPASFNFPYLQPYDIQLQLMQTVFRAIEDGKIAIVESPTGTGKSLTLLTSTLTWLAAHQKRLETMAKDELRAHLQDEDPDDPPWVVEHAYKTKMHELEAAHQARQARLAAARERDKDIRNSHSAGAFRRAGASKRVKLGQRDVLSITKEQADDEFLPVDENEKDDGNGEGVYLSAEVQKLMASYEATCPKAYGEDVEDVEEEDIPKIYYTSRTHTQLRQLTAELLKTSFPSSASGDKEDTSSDGISMVPLASRKQLCINDKVRVLAKNGGDEQINEACLDMQKSGKERCEYLPGQDDQGAMLDARDAVLATVRDIEDLVVMGRRSCVCPYYATRKAVKQAQLVTLPYNLLLQKNAREALDINLKDQIIVIDEAHNLIDTLLSIHSTNLPFAHISSALSQLQQYHQRFHNRLKPVHALWIQQTLTVLRGLCKVCENKVKDRGKPELLEANDLMRRLGGGGDQVNLMQLVGYLKESKLARKVSGFAEKMAEEQTESRGPRTTAAKHASIASFHLVEAFLLALTDARDDGRVLLSIDETSKSPMATLKYILLNPAERFREIVEQARCVILAGGTMEPTNLLTRVVMRGPRKVDFEFKYASREDEAILGDLGAVITSIVGLVPDGIVVFLPSYVFLEKVKSAWTQSGLLTRLNDKKQVFYEPQTSGDVETVLREYALAISSCQAAQASGIRKKTGALLFAVVGAKLSEGINFQDSLGRCVIMVGLPFANVGSVELQERMKYVEGLPGAGKDASRELYEACCAP